MSRAKGRRYDKEPKLNMKKVIAVILAIIVIVMFVIIIRNIVSGDGDNDRIRRDVQRILIHHQNSIKSLMILNCKSLDDDRL